MVMVIALLIALVILMTLLHQARGELNAHPPSSKLRGFHIILLITPLVVIAALLIFVFAIAGDLILERVTHGLLILAGWMVVSIQIFTVFTLRQSDRKPQAMTQAGQFLPVPFIIYLTPIQNFLRLFEVDLALGMALVTALTLIIYSYVVLLSMNRKRVID